MQLRSRPIHRLVSWAFVPAVLFVAVVGIGVLGKGRSWWTGVTVLLVVAMTFAAEHVAPYSATWRVRDRAFRADLWSAGTNELLTAVGVVVAPTLAAWASLDLWPTEAPLPVRLALGIVVLDAGVTLGHWWSHRQATLWRFHAVHHGATRLYGLNGLMKHPVHLAFETLAGMAPLIVMGIDGEAAAALAGLVAVQLVLQHANVDYAVGPLDRWAAWNAGHRLHHVADEVDGNVNFGLFTLGWDRLLGTYRAPDPDEDEAAPVVGLADGPPPSSYVSQLLSPWTRGRSSQKPEHDLSQWRVHRCFVGRFGRENPSVTGDGRQLAT